MAWRRKAAADASVAKNKWHRRAEELLLLLVKPLATCVTAIMLKLSPSKAASLARRRWRAGRAYQKSSPKRSVRAHL